MIKDATALLDYIRDAVNSILTSVQGIATDVPDVSTIQSDIAAIAPDVGTIQTDIATMKADLATVKADLATAKTDIAGILADTGGTLMVQSAAGEAHIGAVGGHAKTVATSFTRPNDTTAYAAGDAVSDSTSAATVITFSSVARTSGGSGVLLGASILDSANQATAGVFELWLFKTSPAGQNDNAAVAFTDAELANLVAVVPLNTNYVGNSAAGASGNRIYDSDRVDKAFVTSGSANLFGVLVVRNAYTPVALEIFTVTLYVLQD